MCNYENTFGGILNNIKAFFFVGLFIIGIDAFAQSVTNASEAKDFSLYDSFLNNNYQRGPYLVYDCSEKHWVCTGDSEFKRCKRIREKAIKDNKKNLPCGMIKGFKSERQCHQFQLKLTSRNDYSRFCFHDEYRKDHKNY